MAPRTPIQHVVVIFKENHGFDNYFGTFPGANGATLAHSPNPPTQDPEHRHKAWLNRVKGAARERFLESDIPTYFAYARRFTLCDDYFTDVAGSSTPNHLMVLTADSPLDRRPSERHRAGWSLVADGDLHHLGRLGRLVRSRQSPSSGEMDRRHAVPLRLACRLPGSQPLRQDRIHFQSAALARQPHQVLRDHVWTVLPQCPRRGGRRYVGLF